MATCAVPTKVGDNIVPYDVDDTKCPKCTNSDAVALGKIEFFGKDKNGKPLFVLLDHKQFQAVRLMTVGLGVGAGVFGIAAIVLAVLYAKHKKSMGL